MTTTTFCPRCGNYTHNPLHICYSCRADDLIDKLAKLRYVGITMEYVVKRLVENHPDPILTPSDLAALHYFLHDYLKRAITEAV